MKDWVIMTNHTDEIRLVLRHINRQIFFFGPWIPTQLMPQYENSESRLLVGNKDEMIKLLDYLKSEGKIEDGTIVCLPQFYPDLYNKCRQIEVSEKRPY